jgi:Zn-dependent peptidase ImmA (M78 family)
MNFKAIEKRVTDILASIPNLTLPIKVEEIAKSLGLKIVPQPLDETISGMLIIKDGIGTIAYNQTESNVRRRFTIAHELGHFILHKNEGTLFLDKNFSVLLRSQMTPETVQKQRLEQEANAFAAAILMPEELLKMELELKQFDFGNEEAQKELAKKFNVSSIAMYYRMRNLELI